MRKVLFVMSMITFLVGCNGLSTDEGSLEDGAKKTIASSNEGTSDRSSNNEDLNSNEKAHDDNEVSEFVKENNNLASLSEGVDALASDAEIDDTGAQVLFSSPNYGIIAIYEEDVLDRYSIVISKNEPYEDLEGNALNATLHVASVLNLDYDKLADEFKKAIDKETHAYSEGDYTIAFFNHKLTGQSDFGLVVEFVNPLEEVK